MRQFAIVVLAGCANPISNQLFEADEKFLAALPGEERIGFSTEFALLEIGDDVLLQNAWAEVEKLDALVREPTRITNALRLTTPGERSATHRAWPPRTMAAPDDSDADLWWLRANITRADETSDFTWSIEVSVEEEGPWREIGFGRHDPEGIGTFTWDYETQEVLLGARYPVKLEVQYTHLDTQREVLLNIPILTGVPQTYLLVDSSAFGWAGLLEVTDDGTLWPGQAQIFVQANGTGRGNGSLQRGDEPILFQSCWSASGDTVFAEADADDLANIGSASSCTVPDIFSEG